MNAGQGKKVLLILNLQAKFVFFFIQHTQQSKCKTLNAKSDNCYQIVRHSFTCDNNPLNALGMA